MPASRAFIGFSLGLAFILNLLPWGEALWAPDFVALVLVFWCVRQPRMVGIGVGFLLGLLMDVHNGALLGEHALAYSLLAYGAIAMHRRVPWFGLPGRMLHVLPLLLAAQACVVLIRMAVGAEFPGWVFLPAVSLASPCGLCLSGFCLRHSGAPVSVMRPGLSEMPYPDGLPA